MSTAQRRSSLAQWNIMAKSKIKKGNDITEMRISFQEKDIIKRRKEKYIIKR
jgi:hypothetical protein